MDVEATRRSLLRIVKLYYLLHALLLSPDGRASNRDHFGALECVKIPALLTWLNAYTDVMATRQRRDTVDPQDDATFEQTAAAIRFKLGATTVS